MIKIIHAHIVIQIDIYLQITLDRIVIAILILMIMEILNVQFAQIYAWNALNKKINAQAVQYQILDNCQGQHVFVHQDCNHKI